MGNLVRRVGMLASNDRTCVYGESLHAFWCMLHVEYAHRIRDTTIVRDADEMGITTLLIESWLEKKSEIILNEIVIQDEKGCFLLYTKRDIDGWYYHKVYCATLDLLIPRLKEQQNNYRYFVNTLKKQGWEMTALFEQNLLNKGVFLSRYRDQTKRIPYDFMRKLNIKMK